MFKFFIFTCKICTWPDLSFLFNIVGELIIEATLNFPFYCFALRYSFKIFAWDFYAPYFTTLLSHLFFSSLKYLFPSFFLLPLFSIGFLLNKIYSGPILRINVNSLGTLIIVVLTLTIQATRMTATLNHLTA